MTQTPFEKHGPVAEFEPIKTSSAGLIASIKANQDATSADLEKYNNKVYEDELRAGERREQTVGVKALAKFSKTLAQDTKPFRDEWSDKQDFKIAQLIKAGGNPYAQAASDNYASEEIEIDNWKGVDTALGNEARERGEIDVELQSNLRNDVEWYNQRRYKRLLLIERKKGYGQFYQHASYNFAVPLVNPDGTPLLDDEGKQVKKTLQEAGSNGQHRAQIQAAISNAWMRPFTGKEWDQGMVKKYLYDGMNTYEDQEDTEYLSKLEDDLKLNRKRELKDELKARLVDGPEGILSHANNRKLEFLGGGKGSFRIALQDTIKLLDEMIDDKEIDRTELTDFLNTEVPPGILKGDPQNKKGKTYLEAFPELEDLEESITERDKKDNSKISIENKKKANDVILSAKTLARKVFETEGREVTDQEIYQEIIEPWYRANPGEALPEGVLNVATRESRDHERDQAFLKEILNERGYITDIDTRGMGWSSIQWAEQQGNRYVKGDALEQALKGAAPFLDGDVAAIVKAEFIQKEGSYPGDEDYGVRRLHRAVKDDVIARFNKYYTGGDGLKEYSRKDAIDKALQDVAGKDGLDVKLSTLAGPGYGLDINRDIQPLGKDERLKRIRVKEYVLDGPLTYEEKLIPGTEKDREVLERITRGEQLPLPDIYTFYAAQPRAKNVNAWDVAAAQYKLETGRELRIPRIHRYFKEKLTPEQQELINNKGSQGAINRIIVEQSETDFDDDELIYQGN